MGKVRSIFSVIGVLSLYYVDAIGLMLVGIDSLTTTVILDIIMATFIVIWWKSSKEHRITPCNMKGGFGALLCVFVAMFVLGQLTGTMIENIYGAGAFAQYKAMLHANPWITLLLSLVVAPIAEECLVRGFVYQQLRRGWSVWVAWIGQAIVFALMHGTLVHLIPTFMTALFLGLVYERTGDLRWPIGFHMVYNLLVMFVGSVPVADILCTPLVDIPLDIICVVVMAMMYKDIINRKSVSVTIRLLAPMGVAQLAPRPVEKREEESYGSQEDQDEEND